MKSTASILFVCLLCALLCPRASAQLLISEYVEGTVNNKALEIWNVSSTNVTFGVSPGQLDVRVIVYANGAASPTSTITLTPGITLAPGAVFVLAHSSATFASSADQTSTFVNWNGDDAVVLSIGGVTVLDSIGQVGTDPGTEWGTGLISTADNTLRRPAANLTPDVNTADAYDPAAVFEGFALDTFDDLGISPSGPRLEIQRAGANVVLSWPAVVVGFQLQYATNLVGAGTYWSNVIQAPVIAANRQWVTNSTSDPRRVYRLRK